MHKSVRPHLSQVPGSGLVLVFFFIPYLNVWPLASHTLQTTVVASLCMQSAMPQAMRDPGVSLSVCLSLQPCVMRLAVQQYLWPLQPLKQ